MNNNQRKELAKIIDRIEDIKNDIEYVRDEEQEKIDNLPENLQGSEKYSLMEEAVSNLDYALSNLEDVVDNINLATE
jgi:hypothetical protein